MNTNKFYNLVSKALNNIDLKRITKKMDNSSNSNSDLDYEFCAKQEICRSKPAEKPDCKMRAVDENFQTKKPRIDTGNGKRLQEFPYHGQ